MRKLTTESVSEIRKANFTGMFNLEVALEAAAKTVVAPRNGALSGFSERLIELLNAAPGALAIPQIVAAFKANGIEITNKMVADRCWLLAKRGSIEHGSVKGTYCGLGKEALLEGDAAPLPAKEAKIAEEAPLDVDAGDIE